MSLALREKCPYSEFSGLYFLTLEILIISPYSVRMRENTDQKNSEFGHLLRYVNISFWSNFSTVDMCDTLEHMHDAQNNVNSAKSMKSCQKRLSRYGMSSIKWGQGYIR